MSLLAVFAGGFIPVTKSESFKINAAYYNVYRQFISPKNWLNWQHELKETANTNQIKIDSNKTGFLVTAPSLSLSLQNAGLGNFFITKTQNSKTSSFNCILSPENTTNKTAATVIFKTNIFGILLAAIANNGSQSPLAELKTYIENTRLYYGFTIKKELTSEKLIAVRKGAFLNTGLYQNANRMLDELKCFIANNNLKIIASLQMQYVTVKKDSTQIMLGLPVNKKIPVNNDVEYMTMPKGKILVGNFSGVYKNKEKIYDAMRRYMADNYVHAMIQPFERFDSNKLPASDTDVVNMQLVIPYM